MEEFEIKPGAEGPVDFWELAGFKQYKQLRGETPGQFLARINDPTKWIYGSELRDITFLDKEIAIPRYAHLARKVLIHYAGERYNPHTVRYMTERFVRELIKNTIEYKVQGKVKDYDWTLLDAFFAKVVGDELNLDIPYDKERLEEGLRPEFRSPFHGLNAVTD